MSLAGYLSEYSLAEIFHFVQDGNKTGVLSIEPDLGTSQFIKDTHYVSFQNGRIMSVENGSGLGNRGLLKMMEQRKWISTEQFSLLETQVSLLTQPLGTYLKSRSTVGTEQLSLLFNSQVIATACKLFEIHNGKFKFDPQAHLNYAEMTGLSLEAQEVALLGLRMLKNWSGLTAKLPMPEFALQRFATDPKLRLDNQELQVWKLSLGTIPIAQIAKQLGLEIEKVQQIGFRLISIGLMQEVTVEPVQPPVNKMMDVPQPIVSGTSSNTATAPAVSASFLSNLMGFLKKKG
jgi:Domain of unknown function (DUF4388)